MGNTQLRKPSEFSKIVDAFMPESRPDIGASLLKDIVAPALKQLLENTVRSALGMWLWGSNGTNNSILSGNGNSRINYYNISNSSYSKPQMAQSSQAIAAGTGSKADFPIPYWDDRGEVDKALLDLQAAAERSKCITVADLYSVAQIESDNYQIHKYGWPSEEILAIQKPMVTIDGRYYFKLSRPRQI